MSEEIKVYNLDAGGVQLVKKELQMSNNELRAGQNAVFGIDDESGDLMTRPGIEQFNADPMDGAVLGFINVGLADDRPVIPDQTGVPIAEVSRTVGAGQSIVSTGADTFSVTADENDATFVTMTDDAVGTGGLLLELRLTDTLVDPGHTTGWKLRLTARTSGPPLVGFVVRARAGTTSLQTFDNGFAFTLTGSFTEYELDFTSATAGYLADPRIRFEMQGGPLNSVVDISRMELFIPGA
jgi:hypothetical protein